MASLRKMIDNEDLEGIFAGSTCPQSMDAECHDDEDMDAREFSDTKRENLADKGKAMPGGGYPIVNDKDLKNAKRAIGRAAPGERQAVIRHINKRAKALGAPKVGESK